MLANDPSTVDGVSLALTDATNQIPPGDFGAAFAKMILTLLGLVLLMLVSYWFIKKIIQQRLQKGIGTSAIQVLEKKMISPKTMLYLIEVDHKKILIAESHLEVKRLEAFPDQPLQES
jgi:flagellar biogenesis protein FliO